MKRSLFSALTLALCIGCGGNNDNGTVSINLVRVGDTEFEAVNGAVTFPITLTEGKITFDAINLVENGVETEVLAAQTVYDYVANDQLDVGTITVVPTTFDEIHVIPGVGGDGLTLRMAFTVTLSDQTEVEGEVNFALEEEEEQVLPAIVDVSGGDVVVATVAFDQQTLLNGIDFDELAANLNQGETLLIDSDNNSEALDIIEANLLSSFAFVSVQ